MFNMVHHAWAHPSTELGSSHIATLPMGIFTTLSEKTCRVEETMLNNLELNNITFMKCFVHKHETDPWSMCCSPDNATFKLTPDCYQSSTAGTWSRPPIGSGIAASTSAPASTSSSAAAASSSVAAAAPPPGSAEVKFSHFWTVAIAGLPDPPGESILERSRARDGADKPQLGNEGYELFTKWESTKQITAHKPKVFKEPDILSFVKGSTDFNGIYFDGMPDDCSFTFDVTYPVAFTATLLKGGAGTQWSIQYSDDARNWTHVAKFAKPFERSWNMCRWEPVGEHRFWRYQCVKNGGTDYYRGVEWYTVKTPESVSTQSEEKAEEEAKAANAAAGAAAVTAAAGDVDAIARESAAAAKKVRVCVSLQWLCYTKNPLLQKALDKATNLGELLEGLKGLIGEQDDRMVDLLTMFSPVTGWAPDAEVAAARAKNVPKARAQSGWHKAQKSGSLFGTSYASILGGGSSSSAGSIFGGSSHSAARPSFGNSFRPGGHGNAYAFGRL